MDGLNLENRLHKDEYSSNRHHKKIAALILAIIIYLFFMGPLVVDMVPDWWRGPKLHESFFAPDQEKNPPRLAPAPVKYMSAPRSAQQPVPTQPQPQPVQPVIPQEIIQETPEIPEIQEPIKEQPPKEPTLEPTKQPPTRDTPAELPPVPQKIPRKRERTGRKKWLKESAQEQKVQKPRTAQQQQNQQKSLVSQVSQGLYEHMYYEHAQRESKSFEAAVANNNDNAAKSFELNIFLSKFVKAFCDYSSMNPLFVKTDSIPPHIIQFESTFSRKRKIINITFIKESADHRVGQYIRTILSDITTPQLPSIWKEDEITMRFSIDLTKPHPGDRIWFVPGQF